MKSLRFINRQTSSGLVASLLLLASILPGLVPAFASADALTTESMTLTNSTAGTSDVSYELKFTAIKAAGAFVVDFCSNSPVVGQSCTAPTGFTTTSVATSTSSTTVSSAAASTILVTKTINAADNVDVVFDHLTNPTSATDGTTGFYARIITYDNATDAGTYAATNLGTNPQDGGGIAMAITSGIGVTAAVRETLTFCVAGAAISANCGDASTNPPSIILGEGTGTAKALSSSAVSTGSVYTQLTTNAASGAVINLKSSTSCGGLKRLAAASCDITPASSDITAGTAKFGVKTASPSATSGVTDATGTLEPVTGSNYGTSAYHLNYASDNSTGVTSTYGDPFLDSSNAPINNQNMQITFGASISNNTPAGLYTTSMSMIATGKY